ncbi:MAG: DoxX family protein [Gemmatimonadota bacterium]|jgi:putative oxidoreductase|nr:MAG: DoxX family protein [Gemmatimonadota bacterium]
MKPGLAPLQANVLGITRIAIGFLFWVHGAQKLLGWFGGFGEAGTAEFMSRFGAAGVVEFVGGLLIILGLFTVPAAFIASGQMAVAYFWMHVPRGSFWPWENGGEKAAFYAFFFLLVAALGAGSFSVDGARRRAKGAEPSG